MIKGQLNTQTTVDGDLMYALHLYGLCLMFCKKAFLLLNRAFKGLSILESWNEPCVKASLPGFHQSKHMMPFACLEAVLNQRGHCN